MYINIHTFCKDEYKDVLCPAVSTEGATMSTEQDQHTDDPDYIPQLPDPTPQQPPQISKNLNAPLKKNIKKLW